MADSQVIVAQTLTKNASDAVMVAQIKQNTGRQSRELSADAGYCSEYNQELKRRQINGYIAGPSEIWGGDGGIGVKSLLLTLGAFRTENLGSEFISRLSFD